MYAKYVIEGGGTGSGGATGPTGPAGPAGPNDRIRWEGLDPTDTLVAGSAAWDPAESYAGGWFSPSAGVGELFILGQLSTNQQFSDTTVLTLPTQVSTMAQIALPVPHYAISAVQLRTGAIRGNVFWSFNTATTVAALLQPDRDPNATTIALRTSVTLPLKAAS